MNKFEKNFDFFHLVFILSNEYSVAASIQPYFHSKRIALDFSIKMVTDSFINTS